MTQQGDYPRGRGPGYTKASGFGPQDPRTRPPATPEQWQRDPPLRQDGTRAGQPQYQPQFHPTVQPPPYQQQYQYQPPSYAPPPSQPPRKSRKGLAFFGCGGLGALVVLIAILAAPSSPSSSSPPAAAQQQTAAAPPQGSAPAKAPAAQTVTYVVTGSAADVTFGPSGSDYTGSVPMRVSKPLGTPSYYSINAQLQGDGSVSCQILVNGSVVSQGTASGGYQIASCEIVQDPFSGAWQDANG